MESNQPVPTSPEDDSNGWGHDKSKSVRKLQSDNILPMMQYAYQLWR